MSSTSRVVHGWAVALFVANVLALLVIDVVSWRRTRSLRLGAGQDGSSAMSRGTPPVPKSARASATTYLAAGSGLTLLVIALTPSRGLGWPTGALAVPGLFVMVTGLAWRVRSLAVRQDLLVVKYAARRAWALSFDGCRELRPPQLPMSGWRATTMDGGSRSLMPSDLFGNEWVLAAIVQRAGLSFTGRAWVR